MAPTKVQTQTPTPRNKPLSHNHNAHKQEMQERVKVYKIPTHFAPTSAMATTYSICILNNIMLIYNLCVLPICVVNSHQIM
jgi:hypothetical protein